MKRDFYHKLVEWKHSASRKPLIVRGARQIGKTHTISDFGQNQYDNLIVIDFERDPQLHSIFDKDLSPKQIIPSLELLLNQKIPESGSLLFFDEIQACPRAIMSLRYFYEEMPQQHIIAAGSFLEFALSDISFPVGRVQNLNMFPMTFREYLLAKNMKMLSDELQGEPQAFPEVIHNKLLDELKNYFFVGGMPEAISRYLQDNSLLSAFEVQSDIIHSVRQDFSKYNFRIDKTCLLEVMNNAAFQVGEQIQYTKLNTEFTGPTNKKAFDSLCLARIISKISACSQAQIPLGGSLNPKKFKAILLDIGLMQRMNHLPLDIEIKHSDLLNIYRGKLAEQFVGQQLIAQLNDELFYWVRESKSSTAELDFAYQENGKIIPIEVKSGKAGSLRSLHLFLKSFPDIERGYVYYSGKYRDLPEQKITFLPIYYAGLFKPL